MKEDNNIEEYFSGQHVGFDHYPNKDDSDKHFLYTGKNYEFRLKDESWQTYESKIIKPGDLNILVNDTPFTNREIANALVDIWFGEENEERKEIANRKARDRRAKQKEVA